MYNAIDINCFASLYREILPEVIVQTELKRACSQRGLYDDRGQYFPVQTGKTVNIVFINCLPYVFFPIRSARLDF